MVRKDPTNDRRPCDLGEIANLAGLTKDVRSAMQSFCAAASYEAGQTVAEAEERYAFIGIVRRGILKMRKDLPDGRQHIVGLLIGGDLFGRAYDGPLHYAIEAATHCEVFLFQKAPFEELVLHAPDLERFMLLNMLSELDRARDWMFVLANTKIRQRLAGFLLILCTRFRTVDQIIRPSNGGFMIRIPLSRPDVARLLGTRPESVSRALHALADDGLLTILRPDLVSIANVEDLVREADGPDFIDPATLRGLIRLIGNPAR